MASSSYIQLISKIQAFCDAHLQIERFDAEFEEQRPNLATESEKYPYVFMNPTDGRPNYDLNEITVNITCYDIIQKDRANINTIVSDCHQILTDLFGYYNQGNDSDIIALSATQTPLNNLDLDYVAGWSMAVTFELEGWCNDAIPMNPITPGDSDCEDATVENSTGNYSTTVSSGGTLTLPDTNADVGAFSGTVPSIDDITIDVDDGSSPVTPDNVTYVGSTITISVPATATTLGIHPLRTGQTTSYATGDDGDTQRGRYTDFLTLDSNNPAGNTNRFTAKDGTQTYGELLVDWSGYDGTTVPVYYMGDATTRNFANGVSWANGLTVDTYSDWSLVNARELYALTNYGVSNRHNYAPLNSNFTIVFTSQRYYTTSTGTGASSHLRLDNIIGAPLSVNSTNNGACIAIRYYTLTELGL